MGAVSCSSVSSPWSPSVAGTQAKVSSTVSMGRRVNSQFFKTEHNKSARELKIEKIVFGFVQLHLEFQWKALCKLCLQIFLGNVK